MTAKYRKKVPQLTVRTSAKNAESGQKGPFRSKTETNPKHFRTDDRIGKRAQNSGKTGILAKKRRNTDFYGLYTTLRKRFGHLNWWPGDTRDEIIIGAILTQQASWKNVEMALANLKGNNCMSLKRIDKASVGELERYIRPSGFYRQKARRLKAFARHVFSRHGSLDAMLSQPAMELRAELLTLDGIGKETADSISLYTAGKPVFVIDAYTKRISSRVFGTDPEIGYDELQATIASSIRNDVGLYKDFHGQFVELGKRHCRTKPLCNDCPVKSYCLYYRSSVGR